MSPAAVVEDQLIDAITDSSRRLILDLVLSHGGVTATALAEEVPFTRQAVAKHLAVLDRVGLVRATRQGREVRYSVRPEDLDVALRAMERVAARWDARLAAIKKLAETSESTRRRRRQRLNKSHS